VNKDFLTTLIVATTTALLAACCRPQPPTPGLFLVQVPTSTPAPTPRSEEERVLAVIANEAEAVRQQDIDALRTLWVENSSVVDANHTPENSDDDRRWDGWPAVRERYISEVFPFVSSPVTMPRPVRIVPTVSMQGDKATVVVPASDGQTPKDRWELERHSDGQWRITSLTFNLVPH